MAADTLKCLMGEQENARRPTGRREFLSCVSVAAASLFLQADAAKEGKELGKASEGVKKAPLMKQFIGEEAVYDGYVFKAGVRVHVGKVSLAVKEVKGPDPTVVLKGVAEGGKFGYSVKMDIESVLDHETCLPRISKYDQTGSERRFKKFLFQPGKILYTKLKHCHDPDCRNPKHMIERVKWAGPIPVGKEVVHCPGCDNLEHYVWKVRYKHEVKEQFFDMLSGVFLARTSAFKKGASFIVPVIEDRDRWAVTILCQKDERIKVKAGTFDCVKIVLKPKNVGDRKDKEMRFSGLFGLNGTISIWVDKKLRIPVRILGHIPFAFMNIHCESCLASYKEPDAKKGKEKEEKAAEKAVKTETASG